MPYHRNEPSSPRSSITANGVPHRTSANGIPPSPPRTNALRTRASSAALSSTSAFGSARVGVSAESGGGKAKSAAWMKKLRKWKSKDDGLWGCAGEAEDAYDEASDDAYPEGLPGADDFGVAVTSDSKMLPPLPERASLEEYTWTYCGGSFSDLASSGGSGTSSQRSSLRSSIHSARSRSSSQLSPNGTSTASRKDLLAREQEDALEAITSYMARGHSMMPPTQDPSIEPMYSSRSPPSSPVFPVNPTSSSGPYGTLKASERMATMAYARSRARAESSSSSSIGSASGGSNAGKAVGYYPEMRRSPSMQQLGPSALAGGHPSPAAAVVTATTLLPSGGVAATAPRRPIRPRAYSSAADVKACRPCLSYSMAPPLNARESGPKRTSGTGAAPPLPSSSASFYGNTSPTEATMGAASPHGRTIAPRGYDFI